MSWQYAKGYFGGDPDVRAIMENWVDVQGGIITNLAYLEAAVALLKNTGRWNDLATWISPNFGVKINGSNKIEKVLCLKLKHQLQVDDVRKPAYVANTLNGKSVVLHEPGKYTKAALNIGITGAAPRHEFLLFRQPSPQVNANIMGWGSLAGQPYASGMDTLLHSGKAGFHGPGPDTIGSSPPYAVDTWNVFEREYNGTQLIASLNNGTRYPATITLGTVPAPLQIGRGAFDDAANVYETFNGNTADAGVFSTALTLTEKTDFVNFLRAQYAI